MHTTVLTIRQRTRSAQPSNAAPVAAVINLSLVNFELGLSSGGGQETGQAN